MLATPSLLGRDVMRKFKSIHSEAREYVASERDSEASYAISKGVELRVLWGKCGK
jgi:hypothetical protein